ncbi:BnaC04g54860D [Brassica napus]|uniref:BnaC04g54860D protein n=2 Tax=Brassica napus TaxID=3708 RepID=A0A078J2J8_BRANA|nr:BnaC04g54860D [Brassica napus]
MQITNAFDASLVTLNPQVQEAVDFKERMLQAELPLAIVENKLDYKAVKQQAEDWDDVQVCSISEILVAVELWSFGMAHTMRQIEDPEDLPEPIQNLVGKSFCFGISISSDNVTNGADTYLVAEVRAGEEIHKIESQTAPVSLIESGSSTFSAREVSKFDHNSQNSAEDVTTPFSNRKDNDDLPDVTSASKKLCTDTIKLEKTKTE